MGLFGKKEKKSETEIPALPRLPRLPEFPDLGSMGDRTIHQLPSFPSNSIGKKFSRDSIKDAVSGGRGGEDFYADEFSGDEMRMMREPLRKPFAEEMEDVEERPESTGRLRGSFRQEAEPVFVRIDRFEEGLKLFEGIKNQLSEIEGVLAETRKLKEREEAELHSWENELKRMKMEIEKMGRDIFSKV
ncbi:MAG TPA: hypothetical protein VJ142_01615 [Candidatus Nanoarchaeia archaeon]|nr:hypothetical protein [Candidatus Nanoarchaeia archaeon]